MKIILWLEEEKPQAKASTWGTRSFVEHGMAWPHHDTDASLDLIVILV